MESRWHTPFKGALSVLGGAVWIIGLAGIPQDLSQWATWIPLDFISNPSFYIPIGAVGLFATYDLVFRDKVVRDWVAVRKFRKAVDENLKPGDLRLVSRERFCSRLWDLRISPLDPNEPDWLDFRDRMAAWAREGKLDYARRYKPPEGAEWRPPA